jgi:glycosyltransferase involved in cell wall biosynthesis
MAPSDGRLHAVQISFFSDPHARSPAKLLDEWPTLVDVAEAACGAGARVSVVQASSHTEVLAPASARYHFLPFGPGQREGGGNAFLAGLLRDLAPDVFHVHGLGFPREVRALAALAPGIPILLQDHASRPPRFWHRASWRRQLGLAAGVAFCAADQARPFIEAGVLAPSAQVYEIPESTSRFSPGDRQAARRLTGVEGDPAILWVGHLDANKDPLTVLRGIGAAARELPRLRLYCCFGASPLLGRVKDLIASEAGLLGRVCLLGRVAHDRIEQLMRAADIFVLGSHREGSGYSLLEALACGLPPVVTDIPSFRALTGAGSVGELWPCGDSQALRAAILSIAARADATMRAAVRTHFDKELSSHSLGDKLVAMYRNAID